MGGRGGGSGMGSKELMATFGTADTPSGITLDDFRNLSDDDLAVFMNSVQQAVAGADMPEFLNAESHTQRLVYALGINDPPEIVSDAQLDALIKSGAEEIFHSTRDADYSWAQNNPTLYSSNPATYGDSISAEDQQDMLLYGDTPFMTNGWVGDGTYFSNWLHGSKGYGPVTVRAVLNPNKAKVIKLSDLRNEYDAYMKKHRYRVRKSFKDAARQSDFRVSYSQFALLRGYNVVYEDVGGGEKYINVIDRSALIVSDKYV